MSIRERLKTKRFLVISLAFLIIIAGVPSTVYAYNQHKYNTLIREAELSVQNDEFDEAVILYNLATNYQKKSQTEVIVKIDSINALKESKKVYEDALKQYDLKQYLEAMDTFSKVPESDSKRYELAQIKILQCKQQYMETTLQTIKDRATNKEFETALELLDSILKVDPQHLDALNLKQEYTSAIEKLKEEKEKAAKAAKAAKALEEAQKNNSLSSASKTVSSPIVTPGTNRLTIKDNGYAYVVTLQQRPISGHLNYIVASFPSPNLDSAPMISLDYTGVLRIGSLNLNISGKTNDTYRMLFLSELAGQTGRADLTVTYKNVKYSFTSSFVVPK